MADLRFVHDHNMSAYLGDPPEKHSEFRSMVEGLILSPVNYAIMEHPLIVTSFIRDFWSTVEEHTDAHRVTSIVGKVQGQPITISEQVLRECTIWRQGIWSGRAGSGASEPNRVSDGTRRHLSSIWEEIATSLLEILSTRGHSVSIRTERMLRCSEPDS